MGDFNLNRNAIIFLSKLMAIQGNIFYNEQSYIGTLALNHANANNL